MRRNSMVERKFDGKYSAREKKELEEELDAKAKEIGRAHV